MTTANRAGTARQRPQGATIWLTGLPSSGKTTVARALAGRLRAEGHRVEVLDGDEIRRFLSAGLGFSREDRNTNVQRIGLVAEILARNGIFAVVPVIAPYADSREAVRKRHAASDAPYFEIHVATPLEVCSARDVKGLYARQAAGRLKGLTGVDDPYEPPVSPDLFLETQDRTPAESAGSVHAVLAAEGLV
ncbi:adenylyl-sulfate kinase [Streptomyces sp. VRA16 Mangrove soil]|uniref:adenylyl-sulfate kinase n=1 Tax=Streptomyces sp. VRA16 Mangrove soil TaxID=2817434 RepID=UPI001A9F536B|nr:adenylyl-sulfate kinase [Streptomyces sp. VRA16 Mangrove soil]MBO1335628.1 adenylyl-sulfate kinase [Streptomyces sp. VRA16 Mangrove soil]